MVPFPGWCDCLPAWWDLRLKLCWQSGCGVVGIEEMWYFTCPSISQLPPHFQACMFSQRGWLRNSIWYPGGPRVYLSIKWSPTISSLSLCHGPQSWVLVPGGLGTVSSFNCKGKSQKWKMAESTALIQSPRSFGPCLKDIHAKSVGLSSPVLIIYYFRI